MPTEPAFGVDIERLRKDYLRGNCSAFAVTLHDRTGWPIVGLCERGSRQGDAPIHLLCLSSDGRLVDAAGFRPSPGAVIREFDLGGRRDLDVRPFDRNDIETRFRRGAEIYEAAELWMGHLVPELNALSTKDCEFVAEIDCVTNPSSW